MIKICCVCNKEFNAMRKHAVYCSDSCYEKSPRTINTRRKYRQENKERIKIMRKNKKDEYKRNNIWYDKYLKMNYKIGQTEYNEMLIKQNYTCFICKLPETKLNVKGQIKPLSVDHCHKTGKVRGLLCTTCNTSLGGFKDNIELLENAIIYLKQHGL